MPRGARPFPSKLFAASLKLALRRNVLCLQSLGALLHFELDLLPFIERLVAVALNGREVNENILSRLALDKSIALRRVEPLDGTLLFAHGYSPALKFALSNACPNRRRKTQAGTGEAGGKPRSLKRGGMLAQIALAVQKDCTNPGPAGRSEKAADGRGLVCVHIKYRIQLGDLKQVVDFLGEVQQLEFAAAVVYGGEGVYQFPDPGAVNVIHVGQVDDDVDAIVFQQLAHGLAQ